MKSTRKKMMIEVTIVIIRNGQKYFEEALKNSDDEKFPDVSFNALNNPPVRNAFKSIPIKIITNSPEEK